MRTEQPKMIALSDYRLPDYLIDETHLTFELHESYALVHARLLMQRNPGLDEISKVEERKNYVEHGIEIDEKGAHVAYFVKTKQHNDCIQNACMLLA